MGAEDWTFHRDTKRRAAFRKRNAKWLLYDKYTPARLAYNVLW